MGRSSGSKMKISRRGVSIGHPISSAPSAYQRVVIKGFRTRTVRIEAHTDTSPIEVFTTAVRPNMSQEISTPDWLNASREMARYDKMRFRGVTTVISVNNPTITLGPALEEGEEIAPRTYQDWEKFKCHVHVGRDDLLPASGNNPHWFLHNSVKHTFPGHSVANRIHVSKTHLQQKNWLTTGQFWVGAFPTTPPNLTLAELIQRQLEMTGALPPVVANNYPNDYYVGITDLPQIFSTDPSAGGTSNVYAFQITIKTYYHFDVKEPL